MTTHQRIIAPALLAALLLAPPWTAAVRAQAAEGQVQQPGQTGQTGQTGQPGQPGRPPAAATRTGEGQSATRQGPGGRPGLPPGAQFNKPSQQVQPTRQAGKPVQQPPAKAAAAARSATPIYGDIIIYKKRKR